MPSILRVGWLLVAPSKVTLSGSDESRSLTPERRPVSAAWKSLSVRLASTGWSRQVNCPLAAKVREIDGQAT
jgi:hypothetical protein